MMQNGVNPMMMPQAGNHPAGNFGRDNPNMMFGDWMCGSCDQHNFARRDTCYKCGKPRDSTKGDSVPLHQLQERGGGGPASLPPPRGPPGVENRPKLPPTAHLGDWICPQCHAHNFAVRDTCFKCACSRHGSAEQTVTARPVNQAWNQGGEFVVGRGFVG